MADGVLAPHYWWGVYEREREKERGEIGRSRRSQGGGGGLYQARRSVDLRDPDGHKGTTVLGTKELRSPSFFL